MENTNAQRAISACDALLDDKNVEAHWKAIRSTRARLQAQPDCHQQLDPRRDVVAGLLMLQLSGALAGVPRDEKKGPAAVDRLLGELRRNLAVDPRPTASNLGTGLTRTFLFLADQQPNEATRNTNGQVQRLENLTRQLNKLPSMQWPASVGGSNLSCGGKPIAVSFVVMGGDLCQNGGAYSAGDQALRQPATYRGGWEVGVIRSFYDKDFPAGGLTKLNLGSSCPVYFGLGNHDVQDTWHPAVGWKETDMLAGPWSTPEDFFRYQMWNFICQMHTGVREFVAGVPVAVSRPVYPIAKGDIDADGKGGFNWKKWSFNYTVDVGPATLIQLHKFGGDDEGGRATGIDWLKGKLAALGPYHPIIIVQHMGYTAQDNGFGWTEEKQKALKGILQGYNVIALISGHNHYDMSNEAFPFHINLEDKSTIDELRPGSAGDYQYFALARVSGRRFDYLEGQGTSSGITWTRCYSKAVFPDLKGALTATSMNTGRLDVFGMGENGQLLQLWWWDGAWTWTNWGPPPFTLSSNLAICSPTPGEFLLWGLDQNGQAWVLPWASGVPATWQATGAVTPVYGGSGVFAGPISALTSYENAQYSDQWFLFGVATDGGLLAIMGGYNQPVGFYLQNFGPPPANIGGGAFVGPVAAVRWSMNHPTLIAGMGTNGHLMGAILQQNFTDNGVTTSLNWVDFGAPPEKLVSASICASAMMEGNYELYAVDSTGHVRHAHVSYDFNISWEDLGPAPSKMLPALTAACMDFSTGNWPRMDVFAVLENQHVAQLRLYQGSWQWFDLDDAG